jgi:hypothetical protein
MYLSNSSASVASCEMRPIDRKPGAQIEAEVAVAPSHPMFVIAAWKQNQLLSVSRSSPGKSANRTSPVLGLHFSGNRVYQDLGRYLGGRAVLPCGLVLAYYHHI